MTTIEKSDTPAAIDPRVQARRREVSRERMLRRRRVVLVVLGVLVALIAAGATLFTPLFDVDRIIVRGATNATAESIVQASGVRTGDPLIMMDTHQVARRVDRVPYVATARVKRVFPGTVIITVTERTAIAMATRDDATIALLDAAGRVVETRGEVPPGLPRIDGLTRIPAPGGTVEARTLPGVLAELPPGLRSLVAVLVVQDNEVQVQLVDEVTILLGDPRYIPAKGAVAEAVLSRSKPGTRVVDVRVPTVPVTR